MQMLRHASVEFLLEVVAHKMFVSKWERKKLMSLGVWSNMSMSLGVGTAIGTRMTKLSLWLHHWTKFQR